MIVYYARCSTVEQNESRQIESAKETGAEKIYIDKLSGKDMNRPQLKEMLSFVREGDTVICSDISRIASNTQDLLKIVEELDRKGVHFVSQKESIDTTTPQGRFMLTVFSAMAQLERECIRQRQREGIEIAKREGKYKGRKRIAVDDDKFKRLYKRVQAGEITAVQAQKELGLTPQTYYRRVREYRQRTDS